MLHDFRVWLCLTRSKHLRLCEQDLSSEEEISRDIALNYHTVSVSWL